MVVLISVIHHFQLKAAVNRYKAELKARGEPMELAKVTPPLVPPEKNGASVFLKAAALLVTNEDVLSSNPPSTMHGVAPGKAEVSWAQPKIRSSYATNSWKEVQAALEQNEEALKLLIQITNFQVFDFNLQYDQRQMREPHFKTLGILQVKVKYLKIRDLN